MYGIYLATMTAEHKIIMYSIFSIIGAIVVIIVVLKVLGLY